jgi:hypothetical protein
MKFNIKTNINKDTLTTNFVNADAAIEFASRNIHLEGDKAHVWSNEGNLVHTIEVKSEMVHVLLGKGFFQSHYPQELLNKTS